VRNNNGIEGKLDRAMNRSQGRRNKDGGGAPEEEKRSQKDDKQKSAIKTIIEFRLSYIQFYFTVQRNN
jgi:hypothetical protein